MKWNLEILQEASRETLIKTLVNLLELMGFRNVEMVDSPEEWGIDILALRDDPIAGFEKYVIKVKSGALTSSQDIEHFNEAIGRAKADKGIFVSINGYTKDAKLLVGKEYKGRVIIWDGEKLVEDLNNKEVPVSEELLEKITRKKEQEKLEEKRKAVLKVIRLDTPLLYSFSPDKVFEQISSLLEKKYKIKKEDIILKTLILEASTAYIFSWSALVGDTKDKAVIFSKEEILPFVSRDEELDKKVSKALLESGSAIKATEIRVIEPLTPNEAVLLVKSRLAEDLKVSQSSIILHSRRKVYIPKRVLLELQVGINSAKGEVDLKSKEARVKIEPLSREKLIEIAKEECMNLLGEELREISFEPKENVAIINGQVSRFLFGAAVHIYSGRVLKRKSKIKRDAILSEVSKKYPGGKVISFTEREDKAIIDVLAPEGIVVLEFNLETGDYVVKEKLVHPYNLAKIAKDLIEANFDIKDLELSDFKVRDHKNLELLLKSEDGKVLVKVDGKTGDIMDYFVEITPEKAEKIISKKYPDWRIKKVEDLKDSYKIELENDKLLLKLSLSKDGKLLTEVDKYLKEDVVKKIAKEFLEEKGITADIKELELDENWKVKFAGKERVGEILIERVSGRVLKSDIFLTEFIIEETYQSHVSEKFAEKNPKTETIIVHKERGYAIIKLSGDNGFYYAKVDLRTGKILKEDMIPRKGLKAKIKKLQLDAKYK
ncbi:restriction endonuclease [Thermococcus argininiproducens]|uniref:Restriction endonuclease n=1 Tax=Thermococcus argininiproducens TaxID=2866384 RepID=A0A9E7MCA1_9EURY|nr:restriction endonuclease [Thermococcus argininiproducens]USH00637.1 restriction endonuclease [Thermococcus argininiproducens]